MLNRELLDIYELIRQEHIDDLASEGYLLKHKKSGARILLLSNDDDNKVFSIGFRTPPNDDTGVPHILEHSVLCGSDKYMAKDPFVELCKGSLNTFLNAMTYPDKTVYPVASCNIVDFKNIMDVYLDAVFHPNIAKRQEIFRQEGWHYELESVYSPLTINGVVYNEMKGAYSSPENVLERVIMSSLYPDTAYSRESGGEPGAIPTLSYEAFLDFYGKYYHPCNSYIYLYGDMDMEERLFYLDREYLCKYDRIDIDSAIKEQPAFEKMRVLTKAYSVTESEADGSNDYLSYNAVIGKSTDRILYRAFEVLDYVLLSAPGAPLKQALIDAGIGDDVYSSYDNGLFQPMFSIIAKNSSEDKLDEFKNIIEKTLNDLVKNGIDKKALLAGINFFEFKYREADFGRYPKGLMYGLQAFDSWLYDENEPFMHIAANDTFAYLRNMVETEYYEELITKYILNNTHSSMVVLKAEVGLTAKEDLKLAERLAEIKAGFDGEQLKRIVDDTKALKAYQDEPSTEEELLSIPLLKREDIRKEAEELKNDIREVSGVKVVYHDIFTNGIGYMGLVFDTASVPEKLIPYLGLLKAVIGYIDTDNYSFRELSNEININTGGITVSEAVIQNRKNPDCVDIKIAVNAKALYDRLPKAFELITEMLYHSKFNDFKRVKEIIAELKSRMASTFMQAAHSVAVGQASSAFSKASYYANLLSGYEFYLFVEQLDTHYESMKEEISKNLALVSNMVFGRENLIVNYTSDEKGYSAFSVSLLDFVNQLPKGNTMKSDRTFAKKNMCLGLTNSAKVQYVAVAGNYIESGFKYTGALKMLSVILGYDYLWINVRVKGGAYGCMSSFMPNGNAYMVSYRDPKLKETLDIYKGVPDYLRNFSASERDMTKFVIGTIGNMDTPLNPNAKGNRSFNAYMTETTFEDIQKERDEILNVTSDDIRALGDIVESVVKQNYMCVVGNEEKILENRELFDTVKSMISKN